MINNLPWFLTKPDPSIFLNSDNYLVLDFETTNLDKGDPLNVNNVIVQYSARKGSKSNNSDGKGSGITSGKCDRRGFKILSELVRGADFVVCHNAKFEAGWLLRLGIPIHELLFYDTLIGEYVLRSNKESYDGGLSLDAACKRRGLGRKHKLVSTLIESGICPSEINERWIEKYCANDVEKTWRIFLEQRMELSTTNQLKIFYTKCLQIPVLTEIESKGMLLDKEKVKKLYEETTKQLEKVDEELSKITGGINPNSPKQMAEFIFSTLGFNEPKDWSGNPIRTASGNPSVNAKVIAQLKASNPSQRRFLELKTRQAKLSSQVTKYLEKFNDCCENDNGILFASINQTITKTGRYSSSGKKYSAQFQNFDRNFKPLFKARTNGWLIGEADAAQLEFRVAVFYGQDEQGFDDIANSFDVHSYTASIIGCSRQDAKSHTFKPLYGGTSGSQNEQRYYRVFKEKYPGIAKWQDRLIQEALVNKKIILGTGQRFYYPHLKYTKNGYITDNQKVRNYPVQYLATAEIIPIALVFAFYMLKASNAKSFIINTVH